MLVLAHPRPSPCGYLAGQGCSCPGQAGHDEAEGAWECVAHGESREPGAAAPRDPHCRSEWRGTGEHPAQGGPQTLQHLRVAGACSHAGLSTGVLLKNSADSGVL